MKRLLRRLSRATDSSSSPLLPRPKPSRGGGRCRSYYIQHPDSAPVPAGHLPLRVEDPRGGDSGGTSCRFVVPAELLTAPVIAALLLRSAQEYGYEQSGVLRIPCPIDVFQRVLDSLLLGGGEEEAEQDWRYWDEEEQLQQQDLGWQHGLHRGGGAECGWCC